MASHQKRSASATLQEVYDGIKELLIKVKDRRSPLVDDLHKLAALAARFTELRPKAAKCWMNMAEVLDREGVHLWNTSSLIQHCDSGDSGPLVAALRLAGFRLMEAGLEKKPGIQSLIHVLQTASKTGSTLSEIGMHDAAASVLGCAAKFEDMLRNSDDTQGSHQQAKVRATVVYLSCRMEAAFREGNESVAEYMLSKITEHNNQRISQLSSHDHELLAAKLFEIGESTLHPKEGKSKGQNAQKAIRWLQQAFSIAEKVDDAALPGVVELKRSILISLANAYLGAASHDAENLTRAEATLQELLTSVGSLGNLGKPEYQELLWMRWVVLKRRKAGEPALLEAFTSILDNMKFSEDIVSLIFREFQAFSDQHTFVTGLIRRFLARALDGAESSGLPFVDRLLLALIVHCATDDDHTRAMSDLDAAFTSIIEAEFELPEVPAAACVALLWQYGDRHYREKRWLKAADWFATGAHRAFRNLASLSSSKCHRKAALCHIYQGEYSKAATIVRRCPETEAATQYILLLAAVHQGLEDEAIAAVQGMVKAPDFDRDMLLLATQVSHESKMKALLLTTLEALLHTLKARESADAMTEAVTVMRCIIRLLQSSLAQPAAKKSDLVTALTRHFLTTHSLAQEAKVRKCLPALSKDIMWLWRTAYNCAIQGCSEWEDAEEQISILFDVARKLLELYCEVHPVEADADLQLHIINASFATIAGRVYTIRRSAEKGAMMDETRSQILKDIQSCKDKIFSIKAKSGVAPENEAGRIDTFLHILQLLEVELLAEVKEWTRAADAVEKIVQAETSSMNTFEAVADILWVQADCPVDVLYTVLEAILHAGLNRGSLSLEKFSRWLRAVCTILLGRNSFADRAKAVGYVEQAITVMNDNTDDVNTSDDDTYPMDERYWLLATSYNTGIECFQASLLDEAKRWFEAATVMCRYVPDGTRRADKISDAYSTLLARVASG